MDLQHLVSEIDNSPSVYDSVKQAYIDVNKILTITTEQEIDDMRKLLSRTSELGSSIFFPLSISTENMVRHIVISRPFVNAETDFFFI
jgi:hypothetical protein